jgi:hypothetical protein
VLGFSGTDFFYSFLVEVVKIIAASIFCVQVKMILLKHGWLPVTPLPPSRGEGSLLNWKFTKIRG